jgi:hypothetical protein
MKRYAIKYPDGKIDQDYIGYSKSDVWLERGFWLMVSIYGQEWKDKFWKRLTPSINDSKKKGYSIVSAKIVED